MDTTLMFNAEILCMDKQRTIVDSIVYRDDKIVFVGDEAAARLWLKQTEQSFNTMDAQGACILPGFIDAHLHPLLMAVYEHSIDLKGVSCLDEVERLINKKIPEFGDEEWLLGLQLEEQLLAGGCLPERNVLDRFCPGRPLVIVKRDGHSITANSRALILAGLENYQEVVPGGTVEYGQDGRPNGIFRENAVALVMAHLVAPTIETLFHSAQKAFARLAAQGVTSIGAMLQTDSEGPSGSSGEYEYMAMTALAESIPFAIYSILIGQCPLARDSLNDTVLNSPERGNQVRAFKIFADGTLGSCTACMHQSFFDHPEKAGYLTLTAEEIYQRMVQAHNDGWQICIHAIGDKAIDTCIALYERLLSHYPKPDHRHRIEHASVVSPQSLQKIAELNLVLCCQPLFIRSEKQWLAKRLGPERLTNAYPFKSFLQAGITIAGSSDAPIEDTSVMQAIECCVTRDDVNVDECISVDEAIAMYTCHAAYAQFEEHCKGSLEVGKRADMVMLSCNPHKTAADCLGDIKILKTICAGKISYDS